MVWRVRKRQSSFWDFESPERTQRVHFVGKIEHRFVSNYVDCVEIKDNHPVLVNYQHPWVAIYISTKSLRPAELTVELMQAIQSELGVWRSPVEYLNQDVETRLLLGGGIGLLFNGPEPLATTVGRALNAAEVRFTAIPGKNVKQEARALIAGRNFVIAKDFRNEA